MFGNNNKGLFLGTSAAEMIPDPFCSCEVCNYARLHPEEQRVRSAFLADEETCIDFGPDVMYSSMRFGADFTKLKNIFITHLHSDHFSLDNLGVINCNNPKANNLFTLHISDVAFEWLIGQRKAILELSGGRNDILGCAEKGYYSIESHKAYESFKVGSKEVFTIYGFHGGEAPKEKSLNYRITENGKTLLYALDTGVYTSEALEALSGFPVDVLIMDATFGSMKMDETCTHLDAYSFISQLESLAKIGVVTDKTRIYASHINHYNMWHQKEYQSYFDKNSPLPVTVAYDGLKIDL